MCRTRWDGWWAGLGLKETSGPWRANLLMPCFSWSAHNMHVKEGSISPHAFFETVHIPICGLDALRCTSKTFLQGTSNKKKTTQFSWFDSPVSRVLQSMIATVHPTCRTSSSSSSSLQTLRLKTCSIFWLSEHCMKRTSSSQWIKVLLHLMIDSNLPASSNAKTNSR